MAESSKEQSKDSEVAALLRAALEKIVFFEWRISELEGDSAAAHARCAAAESARSEAEVTARAAQQAARRQIAELEAERARLGTLLNRPAHPQIDTQALEAERNRAARIEAELADARAQIQRNQAERERWLGEMIDQARGSAEEAPAALAQFISELRGEVIALRERQRRCDAALADAGLPAPGPVVHTAQTPAVRAPEAVEEARRMLAEGRIGASAVAPLHFSGGAAAQALAEQCVRALGAPDAVRRAQAARHLAAVPVPGAAAAVSAALHAEKDSKARAQLARALAACGGETAAEIVAALQGSGEPPLVRLAALEALALIPGHAAAALRIAAVDDAAAVRRRAAAIAAALGQEGILGQLLADTDGSVRAAAETARSEPAAAAETAGREAPKAAVAPLRVTFPAGAGKIPSAAAAPAAASIASNTAAEDLAAQDPTAEVLLAVQAAIFGLTEDELAARTGLAASAAAELATKLVAEGRLGRRGRRLVVAEGGAA